MGWSSPDVYNQPEKFGLEIVWDASQDDLCYEFNIFLVLKDAEGTLYYAQDAGCSCPSPFEDYTSVEDLTPATWAEIIVAVEEWGHASQEDILSLGRKLRP